MGGLWQKGLGSFCCTHSAHDSVRHIGDLLNKRINECMSHWFWYLMPCLAVEGKISQEGAPKTVSLTLDILPSVSLLDFIYHFPLFWTIAKQGSLLLPLLVSFVFLLRFFSPLDFPPLTTLYHCYSVHLSRPSSDHSPSGRPLLPAAIKALPPPISCLKWSFLVGLHTFYVIDTLVYVISFKIHS